MARLGEGTSRSVRDGLQCQMPSSFQVGFFPPPLTSSCHSERARGWRARLFTHGVVLGERSVFWELPEGPRPPFSLPQEPLLADPAVASCHHTLLFRAGYSSTSGKNNTN